MCRACGVDAHNIHSIHSPEFSNPLFIIIGKSRPAEVDHVQEYGWWWPFSCRFMSGKSPKANCLPYHPWHFYLSNVTVHNIKRHCWNGFRYRLPRHIMTTSWQSTHCTTQEILRFSETSPPLLVFPRLLQAYDTVSFLFCIRQCHDVCRLQYKDKRKTHSTTKPPNN